MDTQSGSLFGSSAFRELEKGLWPYLKDPVFLLEPFLLGSVVAYWLVHSYDLTPRMKRLTLVALASGVVVSSVAFRLALP